MLRRRNSRQSINLPCSNDPIRQGKWLLISFAALRGVKRANARGPITVYLAEGASRVKLSHTSGSVSFMNALNQR